MKNNYLIPKNSIINNFLSKTLFSFNGLDLLDYFITLDIPCKTYNNYTLMLKLGFFVNQFSGMYTILIHNNNNEYCYPIG